MSGSKGQEIVYTWARLNTPTHKELSDTIDAALRRAKAEGMREAAKQARKGATLWSAGMKEREAAALDEFAVWLDAHAAQIEEGEE